MNLTVHLALGARDGDPRSQMTHGLRLLRSSGLLPVALSSLWETEPVGLPPGPPVLNAAATAMTSLDPGSVLAACLSSEDACGRRRGAPEWRSLDLDILLMEDTVLSGPDLTIPHPRFHLRRFNLEPLCEIAPEARHPLLSRTVRELLRECGDRAAARLLERDWAPGFIERAGALR
jgi:2-amino-4-hydroxy-6-hydroxymethyldihydropteridine diphosphokinase